MHLQHAMYLAQDAHQDAGFGYDFQWPRKTAEGIKATAEAFMAEKGRFPTAGEWKIEGVSPDAAFVAPCDFELKVGDGVTVPGWSDAYACTVTHVSKSGKSATIREDKATLLNGPKSNAADALTFTPGGFCGHMSGVQRYDYEASETGRERKITLRPDGHWREVGVPTKRGSKVSFGRHKHHDYNF